MTATLTRQLVAILRQPITSGDRERAAAHLLDWLGCAAIGTRSVQAQTLRAYLARYGTAPVAKGQTCAALGLGMMSWDSALSYNGAIGNIAEMDDLHRQSVMHPGPVVVPAALACAQLLGASGSQLLDAIVVGYEAAIRIGRALGADHYALFHNTSTCATFGAAAAAGSLLALNDTQLCWALGNAGTRTGGLWQLRHEATMSKQLHTAEAARTGMQAALLASEGFSGPSAILEGPQGFFAAMSPAADPAQVVAHEPNWLLYDCSFKPWPACRHTHAAIDAARLCRAEIDDLAQVESIVVASYSDALTFCDRPNPVTETDAKFSLQHSVAATLIHDRPELEHFYPDYLTDSAVSALRQRVAVQLDPKLDAAYRRHWGARIEITLVNGERIERGCDDALGDPEQPLELAALEAKAMTLLGAAGLTDAVAWQWISAVLALPAGGELNDLSALIGGALEHA